MVPCARPHDTGTLDAPGVYSIVQVSKSGSASVDTDTPNVALVAGSTNVTRTSDWCATPSGSCSATDPETATERTS
eukprot:6040875-Prymnesium_polylepis.2